jgi:hypothetical protein
MWKETERQKTNSEAAEVDGPEAFINLRVVSLGLAGGRWGLRLGLRMALMWGRRPRDVRLCRRPPMPHKQITNHAYLERDSKPTQTNTHENDT